MYFQPEQLHFYWKQGKENMYMLKVDKKTPYFYLLELADVNF